MPSFTNIDIEESATVTARVASVQIARGSTNEEQEILCLGDPDSSAAIAAVTGAAPLSTRLGLNVRIVSGPSSVADLAVRAVLPSTIGDNLVSAQQNSTTWAVQVDGRVRAQNSTIGDLLASVQQNSTVWAAQIDGRVRAQNSTIGDLLASVQQNSTVWQTQAAVRTSSGAGVEGSTSMPVNGVLGLHVRQVFPTLLSTGRSTAGNNSTSLSMVSSVAGQRVKVYAYSITSTMEAVNDVSFYSSAANLLWPIALRSISSGVTGANLAVSPPGWLFATDTGAALNFNVTGTTGTYKVAISYFQEA